jgi:hypothetical protein
MIYTMLAITIINVVEGSRNTPAVTEVPAIAGAPPASTVKLNEKRLVTSVNRVALIESNAAILRVSVRDAGLMEVIAVSNRELMVNTKTAGKITLLVWTAAKKTPALTPTPFDVVVMPLPAKVEIPEL